MAENCELYNGLSYHRLKYNGSSHHRLNKIMYRSLRSRPLLTERPLQRGIKHRPCHRAASAHRHCCSDKVLLTASF